MEIRIDNEERILTKKICIFTENKEFIIYIDNFGELVINKQQYGPEEGCLIIRPKVSNEISIV